MVALVIALAFVLVLTARLVVDVRQDRPTSPPRSHWHETNPATATRVHHFV